tara:strand:+ start:10466 stop:11281 length:816 start_codon:yes stop_codon:yes gene_type:complete
MSSRRGVAMLITLMTMTVLLAGVAIVTRIRVTDRLISMRASDGIIAMDLVHASDSPISSWLHKEAGGAVIEPSQSTPMIPVLDQSFELEGQPVRVRITGWDQSGMIPSNAEQIGLDFGELVVPWKGQSHPGLDQARLTGLAFPSPERPTAVGGQVATHNPWPSRSGTTRSRSSAVININTAPVELIEECFQRFNLGDPSPIFEKRAIGEMAFYTTEVQDAQQNQVRLTSISRVWSFRVDAWVGYTLRSSWCTYANQGGNWRLVQRIGISHD